MSEVQIFRFGDNKDCRDVEVEADKVIVEDIPAFQSPDPKKCTILQRPDYAEVNSISHITLDVKNMSGKSIPCETWAVTASLRYIFHNSIVNCKINEVSPGRFEILYVAQNRGRHELTVKVNEEHIQESPFLVTAGVSPASLGKPVKIIRGLKKPTSIAMGPNSECVVAEIDANRVSVFNQAGEKIKVLKSGCSPRKWEFNAPSGVGTDCSGNVYVVDQQNIRKFSPMGKLVNCFAQNSLSSREMLGEDMPHKPPTISVAPNCNIYVCYPSKKKFITLDMGLTTVKASYRSENFDPRDIAFDIRGEQIRCFITDQENHCVQVLDDQSLDHLHDIQAVLKKQPWMPCGIFVDSRPWADVVYVTDSTNHQVSIFRLSGEHLHSFGCKGREPGEFSNPTGVTVDADGFVYVCDSDNDCVQVF